MLKAHHLGGQKFIVVGTILVCLLAIVSSAVLPLGLNARSAQAANSQQTTDVQLFLPNVVNGFPINSIFGGALYPTRGQGGEQMEAAGSTWARQTIIRWSDVEPTPGARNWDAISQELEYILSGTQRGMRTIVMISGTPAWAQQFPSFSCGPMTAATMDDFGRFMYDLTAKLSFAPYAVKDFEIWNEPDIELATPNLDPNSDFGCWGNASAQYFGGGTFADMLQQVYPQVKAANPGARVLVGGLLLDCDPRIAGACPTAAKAQSAGFLEGILNHNGARDGHKYFDGISYHAYDYYFGATNAIPYPHYGHSGWGSSSTTTGPVAIAKAEFIRSVLAAYNVTGKFLMNSESAVVCLTAPSGAGCETGDTSPYEQVKAGYVAQVYAAALAQRLEANVWYSVLGWRFSGLLNEDLTPRLSYTAYKVAARELTGATFSRKLTNLGANLMGYEFTRNGKRTWVVWALDGSGHTVNLGSTPQAVFNAVDGYVLPSATISGVTSMPVYILWNN